MKTTVLPRQPEVVTGKGHQHRSHAEVDPAMGPQGAHTGIHKRHTGSPFCPGRQKFGIALTDAAHQRMKVLRFDLRLAFQLLDEMAVPMQPGFKTADPPAVETSTALQHLAHRHTTPTEISREAGAPAKSGVWA